MQEWYKQLEESLAKYRRQVEQYKNKQIIVFGTGNTAELYQKCFEREALKPIFYLDNNAKKWHQIWHGVEIISPKELELDKSLQQHYVILICSANEQNYAEIEAQLAKMNLPHMGIDQYVFGLHMEEILQVLSLLQEEKSKKIFAEVALARMGNSRIPQEVITGDQYFAYADYYPISEKEVFVDIGAYVGDSVEQYLWKNMGVFHKIWAFEPSGSNTRSFLYRKERLCREWGLAEDKIELVQAAIGKTNGLQEFAAQENGNTLGGILRTDDTQQNVSKVPVYCLDSFFSDIRGPITSIKADIESYEYDMLLGAKKLIKEQAPKLAISMYHNATDFYQLPLLVHHLHSDYKLGIRHHAFTYAETVLYAY